RALVIRVSAATAPRNFAGRVVRRLGKPQIDDQSRLQSEATHRTEALSRIRTARRSHEPGELVVSCVASARDRRFEGGFQLTASYTWSKYLDSTSEGAGNMGLQDADRQNRTSVPVSQGGLLLDRGLSDFDRTHRLTIVYLWAIPGPRSGWSSYALGGWSIAGVTTFQSGTPFTLANGTDRNNDGI